MRGRLLAGVLGVLWAGALSFTYAQGAPSQQQSFAPAPAPAQALTLAEAHAIALQNHPGIAAAGLRAQAEHEVYVQARAGLLPQVSLYGSAVHAGSDNTRIMAGSLNNPSVFSRTAVGAGLSQLITDFGHTTNLAASSKLQASAAEHTATATREQVLLEVDRAYFATLRAQGIAEVAKQTLDTRQLLLERVSVLAENKLKSELDVSFAQVGLEDARLLQQKAQNDVDSAMAALATVLGYRDQCLFSLADEKSVPVPQESEVGPLIEQAL